MGALALSALAKALLLCLISGVTSLSSLGSGDFGVSPAEESSKSLFGFRGVLKRLFHAGMAGRGLDGEDCWLPIVLDFEGESNPLCVLFRGDAFTPSGSPREFTKAKGERLSIGPVRLSN